MPGLAAAPLRAVLIRSGCRAGPGERVQARPRSVRGHVHQNAAARWPVCVHGRHQGAAVRPARRRLSRNRGAAILGRGLLLLLGPAYVRRCEPHRRSEPRDCRRRRAGKALPGAVPTRTFGNCSSTSLWSWRPHSSEPTLRKSVHTRRAESGWSEKTSCAKSATDEPLPDARSSGASLPPPHNS